MNIRIQTKTDKNELLEARAWHWRTYSSLQYWWYVAGVLFASIGLAALASGDRPIGAMLILFGMYCLLRKKILEMQFRRRIESIPGFGKVTDWEVKEDGISQMSELGRSEIVWDSIFEAVTTPSGILLYPQKHIYYWLPASGFEDQSRFEELKGILEKQTKHRTIT